MITTTEHISHSGCMACSLVHLNPLGMCSKKNLSMVASTKSNMSLAEGQVLYEQSSISQGIYCVHSGHLLLEKSIAGTKYPIKFCKSGDLLGLAAMFGTPSHHHTITAISAVEVCFIDTAAAWHLFESEPAFNKQVMNSLVADLNWLESKASLSTYLNAEQRIADVLTMIYQSFGLNKEGKLNVPVSISQIVQWCNVSAKTATQLTNGFANKGWILIENGVVTSVLDFPSLKI